MRKFTLVAALLLALTACGDSGGGDTSSTAATDTSPTTEADSTTTTAATTTTADEAAARVEAAQEFEGRYEGEWNNTTFGSTGPVEVEITVDAAAQTAVFTLDLGGFVFGASDPDPIVTELDLSTAGPWEGSNDLLGDYTLEIDSDGHLTLTAPSVPDLGGLTMVVEGDLDPSGFGMTYVMSDAGGGVFAEGVIDVAPAG